MYLAKNLTERRRSDIWKNQIVVRHESEWAIKGDDSSRATRVAPAQWKDIK